MAKVVLDTNFILYCVANRLDFYEELLMRGHGVLISREVVEEIKRLRSSSKALRFKEQASVALRLIKLGDHEVISTPGKYVDKGLKKYCLEHPQVVLATMDKELKKSVPNRKIVIRGNKKLELQ